MNESKPNPQKEVTKYHCKTCNFYYTEDQVVEKILSIMYRQKYDDIQAFNQIKCRTCRTLLTIISETVSE